MWLSKHEVGGGCAVGPHEWKNDGDVTEVPDDLGNDLLRLGGYQVAEAPKPASKGRGKAVSDEGDGKKDDVSS
jgi:hypothetical protein